MTEVFLSVGFVVALTELVKKVVNPPKRFLPLVSVAWGIIVAYLFMDKSVFSLFSGILLGLSASGLYSGAKTVVEN